MAGEAHDWTTGAAKTAAVFVLGAISAAGVIWSLTDRSEPAQIQRGPALIETAGAAVGAPSTPVRPVNRENTAALIPAPEPVADEPKAPPAAQPEQTPGQSVPAPAAPPAPASLARTININTASAVELEMLPGVGPVLAGRIIEHRAKIGRFRSVDELNDVKGIGPKSLEKLKPHCRVQ